MTPNVGDEVTCENGHKVWRLTRDLVHGAMIRADAFEAIGDIPAPIAHEVITGDCKCGAKFLRHDIVGGWKVHVNGAWWP